MENGNIPTLEVGEPVRLLQSCSPPKDPEAWPPALQCGRDPFLIAPVSPPLSMETEKQNRVLVYWVISINLGAVRGLQADCLRWLHLCFCQILTHVFFYSDLNPVE